jgi:diacylglycerol kinase family enzyme
MRALVILNEAAGTLVASSTGDEADRIRAGFASAGVEADVRKVAGPDLANVAKGAGAEGFDTVIAGGGDGTLNTIANALAGGCVAFGVLPLGTHNHFAKELDTPLDLDQAVAALARGSVVDLDVGDVNGIVFLNFSSVGLHPMLVKHRDAQREALGRRKFVAMFFALLIVLRRLPVRWVRIRTEEKVIRRLTPSVIVCNNSHQMKVFGIEDVTTFDRSTLNVFLARATRWWGIVWLILRAAFRSVENAKHFESLVLTKFSIETRHRHARVSVDGEVTDLAMPLNYRVRRAGLKVIKPAPQAAEPT